MKPSNRNSPGVNHHKYIKLNRTVNGQLLHKEAYERFRKVNREVGKNRDNKILQDRWYEARNELRKMEEKLLINN